MSEPNVEEIRRRAGAAHYVNHPTSAFRMMRKLAGDAAALCDEVERLREENGRPRNGLRRIVNVRHWDRSDEWKRREMFDIALAALARLADGEEKHA